MVGKKLYEDVRVEQVQEAVVVGLLRDAEAQVVGQVAALFVVLVQAAGEQVIGAVGCRRTCLRL